MLTAGLLAFLDEGSEAGAVADPSPCFEDLQAGSPSLATSHHNHVRWQTEEAADTTADEQAHDTRTPPNGREGVADVIEASGLPEFAK